MASSRIKGITIELGADTTELTKALKGVDSNLSATNAKLKDVNKLLKLDPHNTELLTQKQKYLEEGIEQTRERLKVLNDAIKNETDTENVEKLRREYIETESSLKKLTSQQKLFGQVAADALTDVGDKLKKVGDGMSKAGQKITAVSTAAATAIFGMATSSGLLADDLNTLAQQTGFSTENLQAMQYAADRIDVSMETITGAAAKMTKQVGSSSKKFEALGVSIYKVDGSMKSAEDIFFETIDALSKVTDETERDVIAMDIFGKGANELAGIIDDGGESFRALKAEAEGLGLIIPQELLDDANAFNDDLDTMKAQLNAITKVIGAKLAKKLEPLMANVLKKVERIIDYISSLDEQTIDLVLTIVKISAVVGGVLVVAGKVISVMGTMATVAGALNVAMLPLTGTILAIIAAVAAVIAIGVLLYKNWDTILSKLKSFVEKVTNTFNDLKNAIGSKVNEMQNNVAYKFTTLKDNALTIAGILKTSLSQTWDTIKETASSKWNNIKENIVSKMQSLRDSIANLWNGIKSFFGETISIPKIKLPHFSVRGSLNPLNWLSQGLPKIDVSWYKKAMEQPYTFTSPTVIGVGEAGSETVIGTKKLNELLASRGSTNNSVVVNVNANVSSDIDINKLANTISRAIQQQVSMKVAAAR